MPRNPRRSRWWCSLRPRLSRQPCQATSGTTDRPNCLHGAVVTLQGSAAPGPAGALRAPLSGVECVWYRSLVFRKTWGIYGTTTGLRPIRAIAPSNLPGYGTGARRGLRRVELGSDRSSTSPFGVTDGRTTVLVGPATCDTDLDVFGINAVTGEVQTVGVGPIRFRAGTFTGRELHAEWVIVVGAPVLAVGTVARSADGELHLISRDPTPAGQHQARAADPEPRRDRGDRAGLPFVFRHPRAFLTIAFSVMFLVMAVMAVVVVRSIVR